MSLETPRKEWDFAVIYEPQLLFNVQAALTQSFISAIGRLAADYVRGQNQPWQYYLGYGFGGAALATGIPGANAILYVIGSGTLRIAFEKSPGAAEARIFLDGVAEGDLDLSDEAIAVFDYFVNIPNDGQYHSVSVLNLGTIELEGATDWLSILAIEATTAAFAPKEATPMAVFVISATIQDAKTTGSARVRNRQSAPVYLPQGALTLAQVNTWHDAYITALDGLTGGTILSSSIILTPTLPAGLKGTPEAGSDVQEGGLFSFDLGNGYSEGIRVPGLKAALFGADGQSIPVTGVTAVEDWIALLTGVTIAGQAASDRNGIAFTDLITAKKSFRK